MNELINEDIVWMIMKGIAKQNSRSMVSLGTLTIALKEKKINYDTKLLKRILEALNAQRKILEDASYMGNWQVSIPEDEKEFEMKVSKESNVSDDKIRFIIRKVYRENSDLPKSSEIVDSYWKEFGKPNLEDFDRHLRDLVKVKNGWLKRTDDFRYYFDGLMTQENIGLRKFV